MKNLFCYISLKRILAIIIVQIIILTGILSCSRAKAIDLEGTGIKTNAENLETLEKDDDSNMQGRSIVSGYDDDPYSRLGTDINNSNGYGYVLPDKFDPRNNANYVIADRQQGNTSLCWMYAPVNATEILTAKNFGSKFELSKAYGAVCLSNVMIPNNYIGGGYYNRDVDSNGYFSLSLQYLTNWNTPLFSNSTTMWNSIVAENDYPLSKVTNFQGQFIDNDFINASPLLNVTNAVYLNNYVNCTGDTRSAYQNDIKHAIYEYGAVSVPVRLSNSYYGYYGSTYEYNYFYSENGSDPFYNSFSNHAITIVGWDDNYPRTCFNISSNYPTHNGAWLVKNSAYRNSFWLSYDEASIGYNNNALMSITGVQKSSDKERMLSYDYLPVKKSSTCFNNDVYLCNVYDVSGFSDDYEGINKVMFYYSTEKSTDYKIKIVPVGNNGNIPSNIDSYSILASGSVQGEGYTTVALNSTYPTSSSNKIAVIVIFSPQYNDSNCYIPYEGSYSSTLPEINEYESYFGFINQNNSISWSDCSQVNQYNIDSNLIIRPVLFDEDSPLDNISISPTQIIDNNSDEYVSVSQMDRLFSVRTTTNRILYENVDYIKNSTGITLKQSFINSLNGANTVLCLDFTNDIQKTITINPKSVITNVSITGDTIVGDLLSSSLTGSPPRDNYEVSYQWQYSINGTTWSNIYGATNSSYLIDDNLLGRYIRLKVEPLNNYCNVETGNVSASTSLKVVVLGDVNLDGSVTVGDVTQLQRYLANIITLNNEQLLAADYNRDGLVNIEDCTLIQKKALGLI